LPGCKSLAELSIPGTHDTCALHGGPVLDLAKCQDWKLDFQLQAGIRALDIRCRHYKDNFTIHHGPISQKINFTEVRDICETFLKDHPSECILMRVMQEFTAEDNTKTFALQFKEYLKGHEKYWYTDETIPTLAKARGKIVLLSARTDIDGIPWKNLKIQDEYEVKDVDKKWQQVQSHLENARKGPKATLYINFASGHGLVPGGGLRSPRGIADAINPPLFDYLKDFEGRTGTVMMDFPNENLIDRIIEKNKER